MSCANASNIWRTSKNKSAGVATGASAQGRHTGHRHSGIGGQGCTKGCAAGANEGQFKVMLLGAATQSGQRGQAGQGGADAIQLPAIDAKTAGVHTGKTMLEQDGYGVYILCYIYRTPINLAGFPIHHCGTPTMERGAYDATQQRGGPR